MNKQERITVYNKANAGYNITGIKKISVDILNYQNVHHAKTLDELYKKCSDAKRDSYNEILRTYKPRKIIGLVGSSHSYSITLVAENGDVLWITKSNNYLVEVI